MIQTIEDGPAGVHFDVHTDDLDAEIERLEGLGATVVDPQWKDHPGSWVVMRDPAGIEFCLVYGTQQAARAGRARRLRTAAPARSAEPQELEA